MADSNTKDGELRKALHRMRLGSVDTRDVDNNTLALVYDKLPKHAGCHWFCAKADELTREASAFLLRMLAYSGPRASDWKAWLIECLTTCGDCVLAFQETKVSSRHTYFAVFQDSVLQNFWKHFTIWEINSILSYLKRQGITDSSTSSDGKSLADISPSVVYYILSDPKIFQDHRISGILQRHIPKTPITGMPREVPPVGLFVLLMSQSEDIRSWAQQQIGVYTVTPMPREHYLPVFADTLAGATGVMSSSPTSQFPLVHIVRDHYQLWSAYSIFLRFVPSEMFPKDVARLVTSHLSDTGNHFPLVLKSFLIALDRMGPKLWSEQDEDPLMVFSMIKDNQTFSETLRTLTSEQESWLVTWVETYVKSLDISVLPTILPLIIQFLCEELQHERYDVIRPTALAVAAKMLYVVLSPEKDSLLQSPNQTWETVDIHASVFVSAAYGKAYLSEKWMEARAQARRLVKLAMKVDIKTVLLAISRLNIMTESTLSFGPPKVREQIWRKMYETILPNDADALSTIFEQSSTISHIDRLLDKPWTGAFKKLQHPEEGVKVLQAINHALDVFRQGYPNAISRHLDFSNSVAALALLQRPGVVRDIMIIMFSPLDSVREPAQGVVGLAFDVDSRPDCLRALLLNFPNAAIDGITDYLEIFTKAASVLPEACSMSKALAICLTDIIDVLCSTPNGLVHQTRFLKSVDAPGPEVLFPKWWNLMCKALVVVFQRTPRWSNYFENDMMVVWMRDALIFGRDMLAQRKVIEGAALALSPQTSTRRGISETGKNMVGELQNVLFELTRWLRLTDEELLHQAFALLQSLLSCFKETGIKPNEVILEKLQKYITDARTMDPKHPRTRLDAARLSRLQDTISSFIEPPKEIIEVEDEDEEVQIVSRPIRKRSDEKKAPRPEPSIKAAKLVAPQKQPIRQTIPGHREYIKTMPSAFSKDDQAKLDSAASIPKFRLSKPIASAPQPPKAADRASSSSAAVGPADESTESEGSEDDEGASLEEMIRKPVVKKPAERRQIMFLDMPTNAKNPALERLNRKEEARRVALRLKPDISMLHRTILSWNYKLDGPVPPGPKLHLQRVPDQFLDVQQYREVFEPLLLMECWAQIQQSKEEVQENYETKVINRQYTDDWVDLDITISETVPRQWFLMDTDIVLLRHLEGSKTYLAKVQSFKTSPVGVQATLRLKLIENDPGPQSSSTWLLRKVFSLTTLHREYAALMGLPYYDLCNTILKANLSEPTRVNSMDVKHTMSSYNLNEPQAKAILSALRTDGFSLIQGPPGTGKTSTICGFVQMYLAQRPKPITTIHVGRNAGPTDKEPPKKILLCAPSNAAIDEVAFRLKEGFSGPGRGKTPPKVVRTGAPKSINISVRDVTLDYLVEQKVNDDPLSKTSRQDANNEIALLRSELESVKRLRQTKLDEMAAIHDNTTKTLALEEEVRKLNRQKIDLTHRLDKIRDKQKSDNRSIDAITRKYRAEVLFEADVICTTLAGAGHDLLEAFDFEMVVIDEAAQAIELSSLIPLKYRCSRCVMVGDPQQLPPTVISQEASKYGYNQSLFVRLQKRRPDAVHLLSIQYRMHPEISVLPSRLFYDGRLLNGPDVGSKTQKPWHSNVKFGEYRFYNVRGNEETGPSRSFINRSEAQVAIALFNRLRQEYSHYDFDFKIGIVTMYRAQVAELRRVFEQRFGTDITSRVDFNTVDGFQGQEKEIIILSCVRGGPNLQRVGFLADVRRMNVALTRAKSSVFVLGNAPSLERSDEYWKRIVQDARERSRLVDADAAFFTASRLPAEPSKETTRAPKPKPASKMAEAPLPPLVTPRELAAASARVPLSRAHNLSADDMELRSIPPPTPASLPARPIGQKRPASDEESARQPDGALQPRNTARNTAKEQRPRPRPTKKQKQAPSLFIPKKRPPPPSDSAGPSTNRRRI